MSMPSTMVSSDSLLPEVSSSSSSDLLMLELSLSSSLMQKVAQRELQLHLRLCEHAHRPLAPHHLLLLLQATQLLEHLGLLCLAHGVLLLARAQLGQHLSVQPHRLLAVRLVLRAAGSHGVPDYLPLLLRRPHVHPRASGGGGRLSSRRETPAPTTPPALTRSLRAHPGLRRAASCRAPSRARASLALHSIA
jgi:hypothetical protein